MRARSQYLNRVRDLSEISRGGGGGGVSLLWRHKKKRWCTKVTTESTNIKEKDKKEQEQNEWIKSR